MRDLRDILAAHRDAALAGLGRVPTSPKTLAAAEVLVAVLRAGGLSDRVIALGLDQLVLYVSAFAFETGLSNKRHDPATSRPLLRRRPRLLRRAAGRPVPRAGLDRPGHDRARTPTSASGSGST